MTITRMHDTDEDAAAHAANFDRLKREAEKILTRERIDYDEHRLDETISSALDNGWAGNPPEPARLANLMREIEQGV